MTLDELMEDIAKRFPTFHVRRADFEEVAAKYGGNGLKVGWAALMNRWRFPSPPPAGKLLQSCRDMLARGYTTIERPAPPSSSGAGVDNRPNMKAILTEARTNLPHLIEDWFSWNSDLHADLSADERWHLRRIVKDKAWIVALRRAMKPGSALSVEISPEDIQNAIDRHRSQTDAMVRVEGRRRPIYPLQPLHVQVQELRGTTPGGVEQAGGPAGLPSADSLQPGPAPAAGGYPLDAPPAPVSRPLVDVEDPDGISFV